MFTHLPLCSLTCLCVFKIKIYLNIIKYVYTYFISGTVRIEMFRNMQNAEIIRKMTEEFDEV